LQSQRAEHSRVAKPESQRTREPEGRQSQRTTKTSNDQAIVDVQSVLKKEGGFPKTVKEF